MDTLLKEYLVAENDRQNDGLELIASENFASRDVRALCGSILTNKYAEGFPGHRYYGGCVNIDNIEQRAIDLACRLFNAGYANVQPHSGSQANMIAYYALLKPGDKILSLSLDEGGHLTHGSPVNFSSHFYSIVHYHLGADGHIDYVGLQELVKKEQPQLVLAGFSSYPYAIDFKLIGQIAHAGGAYFMVDMAHIAGLVGAGLHENPLPYADIVTSTTHKTLRGPRGGLILTNSEEVIKKVNKATFPGIQGGPLENIIGAKAQCFAEALQPAFKVYAKAIIANTKAAADEFARLGDSVSGTDNHLFLLNTKKSFGVTGADAEKALERIGITVNKNMLPHDEERPTVTSGIRIGFAALTTRGANEKVACDVAAIIHNFLGGKLTDESALSEVKRVAKGLKKVENL